MLLSIMTISNNYPDVWKYFNVPDIIDKDECINRIILDCAELELLYSDPDILKYIIRSWTNTESHVWEKLAETLQYEYDPIYNLDVTWEETRTPNITRTRTPNLTETRTPDLTRTRTPNITETDTPNLTETETPTDTTTEAVAGYNESTFVDHTKTTRGGSITKSTTGTETKATTGTDTMKESGTDTTVQSGYETNRETGNEIVRTRRYGNQGVTMTQQMIEAEREIVQFNLYDYIAKSFKNRFCLLVY